MCLNSLILSLIVFEFSYSGYSSLLSKLESYDSLSSNSPGFGDFENFLLALNGIDYSGLPSSIIYER